MTAVPLAALCSIPPETISRAGEFREAEAPSPGAGAFGIAGTSAVLLARDGRDGRIEHNGQTSDARIAFGCLVQPEPGDRVLTSVAEGTVWIIAVLERQSAAPPRLWAEQDIAIVSATGNISLMAAEGVAIDAGARTRIAAPEIDLHAGIARFVLDDLLQVGRRANLYVAKIRSVCEMVETFAEHVLTRAKRGSRFIEESDQLRAGDIDYRAEDNLQLRAKTAFITADTVVRVDAEQIHMG